MADEDFNSVLTGVKDAAQVQNAAPPPQPITTPETKPDDAGLSGVLENVKQTAHPSVIPSPRSNADLDKEISDYQKQKQAYDESQKPSEIQNIANAKDFSDLMKNTISGRIASAFGHGIYESMGAQHDEITEADLDKYPINGEDKWQNAINADVIRPAIKAGGAFMGAIQKPLDWLSAIPSGIISATGQLAEETGNQSLQGAVNMASDPNLVGGLSAIFHGVSPSESAIRQFVTKPPLPDEVVRAVDNGIIIPSDPAIKAEATAQRLADQRGLVDVAGMTRDQQKAALAESQKGLVNAAQGPSLHDTVRQIEPDLFNEKDRLETQQLVLRESFNNPEESFSQEYDEKLAALKQQQVESTRVPVGLEGEELQKAVEESQRKGTDIDKQIKDFGSKEDYIKNEAEKARQQFQANDYRLRDLAADLRLRTAYEKAQGILREWNPSKEPDPEEPKQAPAPIAPSVIIADEYTKRAIAAGRPEEEAKASSAIVQAYYEQLAKDLGNGKTADQLYQENTPTIGKSSSKSTTIKGTYSRIWNTIKLMGTADASTLMHEELHGWLEQRMRFAKEEGTSQRLKDDIAALREWAGFKDKQAETKAEKSAYSKSHEKVADAWERYLQEGVAPSKSLGQVFAQFRDWLGNLYNAAKRGNYPINENIRGIFDRMLAENPERTIIAPKERGKAASNIHEKDAALTPPAEKDAAADKMAKEVDVIAKKHDEEIANAIKAAETGKIPKPAPSRTKPTNAGQPAGETGTPEKSGKITPSGSKSTAGGIGTRTEPNAERSPTLLVPPANPSEAAIIGKGGKINTSLADKIGHQEFLKRYNAELLRAEQNGDINKLFSFEDTVKLADLKAIAEQMNMTVDQMKNIQTDYGSLTERPILRAGAYILMKQLHEDMMAAAQKAISSGQAENMAEFLKTYDKRDQLLNAYKTTESLSKEAGVHLVASKIIEAIDVTKAKETGAILYQMEQLQREGKASPTGLTKEDLDKVTQLANMIGKSDNAADVANILNKVDKPTFWDNLREAQVVILTSGLVTHMSYFLGQIPLNLFKSGIEDTITAMVDKLRIVAGFESAGDNLTQGFRGVIDQLRRMPNTLLATGEAVREGKTVLLPREDFTPKDTLFNNMKKTTAINPEIIKQAVADNFTEEKFPDLVELRERMNDAMKKGNMFAAGRLQTKLDVETARKKAILEKYFTAEMQSRLRTWGDVATASKDFMLSQAAGLKQMMQDENSGSIGNPLYSVLKQETKAVYGGIHTFQRYSIMAGELRAECQRNILAEAIKNKEDLSNKEIDLRTDNLMKNPTQQVMDKVIKTANELSFMNNNNAYVRRLNGFLNMLSPWDIPLGKIIAPITTVPVNMAVELFKRTPVLGTALNEVRADLSGKNGITVQNKAVARQLAGLGVIITGYILAQNKSATPSASINHKHDEQKIEAGEQPSSIRVGDSWVDISTVPVLSNLITLGADLHYIRDISLGKDESEILRAAVFSGIRNFALHENSLINLSDAMDAVTGKSSLENYLKNMASSITAPALISQLNQDPDQREAKTLMDKLKSKVQETSETLAPKISPITGEVLKSKQSIIPGTRFHEAPIKFDPIAAQLTAIHMYPANPHPNINGVDLSPQQGAEYSSIKGHILYNGMQMLMQGDGKEDFDNADTNGKRKMAIRIETHASQCAKSYMFNKYPDLLKDANDKYEQSCRDEIQ